MFHQSIAKLARMEKFSEVLTTLLLSKSNTGRTLSNFLDENEIEEETGMLFVKNTASAQILSEVRSKTLLCTLQFGIYVNKNKQV